jgi:hypothetical protein
VEIGRIEFGADFGPFGLYPDVNTVAARALEIA